MEPTAPQRRLMAEGEFDSPSLIQYKISSALKQAKDMEGWDVFSTDRDSNTYFGFGATATVAARFWEKSVANEWANKADGDKATLQKWHDERFNMPCWLALVEYKYSDYEEPDPNY